MDAQAWSLLATFLMFGGGALLSVDMLLARRRWETEEGATELVRISEGRLKDKSGQPLEKADVFHEWVHSGFYSRTLLGVIITTAGFLIELIVKVCVLVE